MTVSSPTHTARPGQSDHTGRSLVGLQRESYLLLTGLLVGFGHLVVIHLARLWQEPQYQYFPFVLVAFGYLAYSRLAPHFRAEASRQATIVPHSPVISGVALVILLIAAWLYDPWLSMFGLIVALAGITWRLKQQNSSLHIWRVWMLLLLLLPLPLSIDQAAIVRLQWLSSRISSEFLDLIHINHVMDGNVLLLPDKQFFVDEACSGIVSVLSVVACGAFLCVALNRPAVHSMILLVVSVAWAVVLNIARISIIAVADHHWNADLSEGTPHEVLGLMLYVVTVVAVLSTDQLLLFALAPIKMSGEDHKNWMIRIWNRLLQIGSVERQTPAGVPPTNESVTRMPAASIGRYAAIFGVVFAVVGATYSVAWSFAEGSSDTLLEHAAQVNESVFQQDVAGWQLRDFEPIQRESDNQYGEFSKSYRFSHPESDLTAIISLDFPFWGSWHELTVCYVSSGWLCTGRAIQQPPPAATHSKWGFVDATLESPTQHHAYLAYSIVDASGSVVSPPAGQITERLWRRLRRRGPKAAWPRMLQIQAWVDHETPLTEQQVQEIQELFLAARSQLLAELRDDRS